MDDVEAIQPFALGFGEDLGQRPIDVGGECLLALLDLLGEGRRGLKQPRCHLGVLGALAAEEEDGLAVAASGAAGQAGGIGAGGQGV